MALIETTGIWNTPLNRLTFFKKCKKITYSPDKFITNLIKYKKYKIDLKKIRNLSNYNKFIEEFIKIANDNYITYRFIYIKNNPWSEYPRYMIIEIE